MALSLNPEQLDGLALRTKYGKPARLPAEPGDNPDVYRFLYPSQEAAEAFAASNARTGIKSLGITQTPLGWVGVIDIGPKIAAQRAAHRDSIGRRVGS